MKRALFAVSLVLAAASYAAAQEAGNAVFAQAGGPGAGPTAIASFRVASAAPVVVGAPYSATMTNQSIQTLADGNRIVQTFTGSTARDSQGRTRQDAPLPPLGNLSAANAPHLVFIRDPVSQTSYTLDLTNKTAQKMTAPPPGIDGPEPSVSAESGAGAPVPAPMPDKFFIQMRAEGSSEGQLPLSPMPMGAVMAGDGESQVSTENLGSQTIEGVLVNGTRATRTIPAGQIGNEQPITIVTEVWFSPDLKTVVYSQRTDPRTGEQTFRLTNIVRAEPDPSLFTVPADFNVVDGAKPIIYRANQ
jgi:hypothetical protein